MNRLKKLFGMGLAACSLTLTSCGLLDTPEYPDSDFSIVGTWEYYIPALTGSAPEKGHVYNADGWITFTEDMQFSFTLNSDRGEVKGYGTYRYDPDSGVSFEYGPYDEVEDLGKDYILSGSSGIPSINWGNEGDLVEMDYLRVHTEPYEFHRVSQRPFEDTICTYSVPVWKDSCHYYVVDHAGWSRLELRVSLGEILKNM